LTVGGAPVTAATQQALMSGQTWRAEGARAPAALSDRIAGELEQLRHPGPAVTSAAGRRRQGLPWSEAGVPSYGSRALARATGVAFASHPSKAPAAVSLDTLVTHAHRLAVETSAVFADLLLGLAAGRGGVGWMHELGTSARHPALRAGFTAAAGLRHAPARVAMDRIAPGRNGATTLAAALWLLSAHPDDGVAAVALAAALPGDAVTLAAITGALVGARDGASAFPSHWTSQLEMADELRALADRAVADRPRTPDRPVDAAEKDALWFLLDRSGSMSSIADDVTGGFDQFFDEQRSLGRDLEVTLVQFDGQDPQEVVLDAVDLAAVPSLRGRFQPRGNTPLYDALGHLLDRAEVAGGVGADQLVVVLTDGYENASRRWTRAEIFARITRLQEQGWTFVFLGANQDSYATGRDVGVHAGSTSDFRADRQGVALAYESLGRATREWRGKSRAARDADRDRFWGDRKEAEEVL
jgi:ADP-ribosylglycohydrolase